MEIKLHLNGKFYLEKKQLYRITEFLLNLFDDRMLGGGDEQVEKNCQSVLWSYSITRKTVDCDMLWCNFEIVLQ
jgi:hypothetical protein